MWLGHAIRKVGIPDLPVTMYISGIYWKIKMPKKGLLILVCCKTCGKIKAIFPKDFKRNKTGNFFCNRLCCSKSLVKTIKVKCNWCGKEKEVKPHQLKKRKNFYCSNTCQAKFTSKNYSGKNSWHYEKIELKCNYCGKSVPRQKAEMRKNKDREICYCNKKCLWDFRHGGKNGENYPNWNGGLSKEGYPTEFNKDLKKIIRARDKFECQLCGKYEDSNEKNHCVHHIDYNKENCSHDNLITLCTNCHTPTNSDRGFWQKHLTIYQQDRLMFTTD